MKITQQTKPKKKFNVLKLAINIITFKWLLLLIIKFYKCTLTHIMGKGCIYTPTCSTYTYDAICQYGSFKGGLLGAKRILSCNQFAKGGFDPLPDNPKGEMKWLF